MSVGLNPQIEILFIASARDERSLQFDLDSEVFGLLAQQAVEKLLKALIAAHGMSYPFTHDIKLLVATLEAAGEQLPPSPLTPDEFTGYAVTARYDIGTPLSAPARTEIRNYIAELRLYVRSRVNTLQSAAP